MRVQNTTWELTKVAESLTFGKVNITLGAVIQYWLRTGAIGSGNPSGVLSRLPGSAALTTVLAASLRPSASSTP